LPEYLVSIKIEKLDEGIYLATSDNLQGLVAQGRTIAETMEIAQDVARKLIESYIELGDPLPEDLHPAAKVVSNIKIPVAVSL
jgi:antitoxin HicB